MEQFSGTFSVVAIERWEDQGGQELVCCFSASVRPVMLRAVRKPKSVIWSEPFHFSATFKKLTTVPSDFRLLLTFTWFPYESDITRTKHHFTTTLDYFHMCLWALPSVQCIKRLHRHATVIATDFGVDCILNSTLVRLPPSWTLYAPLENPGLLFPRQTRSQMRCCSQTGAAWKERSKGHLLILDRFTIYYIIFCEVSQTHCWTRLYTSRLLINTEHKWQPAWTCKCADLG